jgi:hypothetical protein
LNDAHTHALPDPTSAACGLAGLRSLFSHHTLRRAAAILVLLAAVLTLPGCEAFSFLAQPFDTSTAAIYEIKDLPTAILVEDPNNYVGDPNLKGVIAEYIAADLIKGDAVSKTNIIPLKAVMAKEQLLGKEYATKPIDEIGRMLNAKQVIHVYIEAASLNLEGGVMKPAMQLRIRLIDCVTGRRLFPKPEDAEQQDAATVERGFGVMVSMPVRVSPDDEPTIAAKSMETLAIRTGKRIGWIFHEHKERQPGEGFNNKP